MDKLEFLEIKTAQDVNRLAAAAKEIWTEAFKEIISDEQNSYMVEKFQSANAITKQISDEGYRYCTLVLNDEIIGYYAICKKEDGSLFLSKLYLKQEMRGKGFSSMMFREIKRIARKEGCELIWLTVNKGNAHAISVYKHLGMRLLREQVTDIGNGFVMDDYVFGIMV